MLCPVMKLTDELSSLWVRGMPAYVAEAIPAVIPGTTRKGMLCWARKEISSHPRPKIMGSPPLSRRTFFCFFARESRVSQISFWRGDGFPPRFPAWMRETFFFANWKSS